MKYTALTSVVFALGLAMPVAADPTLGLGFNIVFGKNSEVNTAVGARIFTDDAHDSLTGALGVDYVFGSRSTSGQSSWRATLGAAYLLDRSYVELNGGYNLNAGGFNWGVGAGAAKTDD